jgi:hypothetical protein
VGLCHFGTGTQSFSYKEDFLLIIDIQTDRALAILEQEPRVLVIRERLFADYRYSDRVGLPFWNRSPEF